MDPLFGFENDLTEDIMADPNRQMVTASGEATQVGDGEYTISFPVDQSQNLTNQHQDENSSYPYEKEFELYKERQRQQLQADANQVVHVVSGDSENDKQVYVIKMEKLLAEGGEYFEHETTSKNDEPMDTDQLEGQGEGRDGVVQEIQMMEEQAGGHVEQEEQEGEEEANDAASISSSSTEEEANGQQNDGNGENHDNEGPDPNITVDPDAVIAMAHSVGVDLSEEIASELGCTAINKLRYILLAAIQFAQQENSEGILVEHWTKAEEQVAGCTGNGHESVFRDTDFRYAGGVSVLGDGPELNLHIALNEIQDIGVSVDDIVPVLNVHHLNVPPPENEDRKRDTRASIYDEPLVEFYSESDCENIEDYNEQQEQQEEGIGRTGKESTSLSLMHASTSASVSGSTPVACGSTSVSAPTLQSTSVLPSASDIASASLPPNAPVSIQNNVPYYYSKELGVHIYEGGSLVDPETRAMLAHEHARYTAGLPSTEEEFKYNPPPRKYFPTTVAELLRSNYDGINEHTEDPHLSQSTIASDSNSVTPVEVQVEDDNNANVVDVDEQEEEDDDVDEEKIVDEIIKEAQQQKNQGESEKKEEEGQGTVVAINETENVENEEKEDKDKEKSEVGQDVTKGLAPEWDAYLRLLFRKIVIHNYKRSGISSARTGFKRIIRDIRRNGLFQIFHLVCDGFRDYLRLPSITLSGVMNILAVLNALVSSRCKPNAEQLNDVGSALIEILILPSPCEAHQLLTHVFMKVLQNCNELLTWTCTYVTEMLKGASETPVEELGNAFKATMHGALCLANGLEDLKIQVAQEFGWHTSLLTYTNKHSSVYDGAGYIPSSRDAYLEEEILKFYNNFLNNYVNLVPAQELIKMKEVIDTVYGERFLAFAPQPSHVTAEKSTVPHSSRSKNPNKNIPSGGRKTRCVFKKVIYKNREVIVPCRRKVNK